MKDNIKNILNKIAALFTNIGKGIGSKLDNEKMKTFFTKYWRYFAVAGLLIVLILVLYKCTGPNSGKNESTEAVTETETETEQPSAANFVLDTQFEQDAYEQLNTLINNYFTAYAAGNVDELQNYAYPISDKEKSYIGVCSQYFENYQNIVCYTKHGLTEGSYLVSAYYELKFYDVETVAPGLEFFYVETDANGNLYINNLYSAYNRERMEEEMNSDIYSVYVLYGQQEDVQAIRLDVQERYQAALSSDANLVNMLSSTFPLAVEEWKNSILAAEQGEAAGGEPATENTAESTESTEPATEQPAPAEEDLSQESVTAKVRITAESSVNVRQEPSAESTRLGKAPGGSVYTKVGEEGDWVQIDFNGVMGYVTAEYVEDVVE